MPASAGCCSSGFEQQLVVLLARVVSPRWSRAPGALVEATGRRRRVRPLSPLVADGLSHLTGVRLRCRRRVLPELRARSALLPSLFGITVAAICSNAVIGVAGFPATEMRTQSVGSVARWVRTSGGIPARTYAGTWHSVRGHYLAAPSAGLEGSAASERSGRGLCRCADLASKAKQDRCAGPSGGTST